MPDALLQIHPCLCPHYWYYFVKLTKLDSSSGSFFFPILEKRITMEAHIKEEKLQLKTTAD